MEEQPKELSVAIIKHRVKHYHKNPELTEKIMRAAKDKKPELIITPQFSFLKESHLNDAYEFLRLESPNTVLVTARNDAWIRTPEHDFDPMEGLDYQVLVYPYDEKKFLGLDLLINFGEAKPVEIVRDVASLRTDGYLIRIINSSRNYVIKKIIEKIDGEDTNLLCPVNPIEHKHMKIFDLYVLKFD